MARKRELSLEISGLGYVKEVVKTDDFKTIYSISYLFKYFFLISHARQHCHTVPSCAFIKKLRDVAQMDANSVRENIKNFPHTFPESMKLTDAIKE